MSFKSADEMIDKDKIKKMIVSYLPKAENDTIENIASNIIRDTEAVISSMIRQEVSQEKQDLYKKMLSDCRQTHFQNASLLSCGRLSKGTRLMAQKVANDAL